MTVRFEDGAIRIDGDCPVEDAEVLLSLLLMHDDAPVDLSGCGRLHAAPFQLLLALRPALTGTPAHPFVRDRLLPMLTAGLSEAAAAG